MGKLTPIPGTADLFAFLGETVIVFSILSQVAPIGGLSNNFIDLYWVLWTLFERSTIILLFSLIYKFSSILSSSNYGNFLRIFCLDYFIVCSELLTKYVKSVDSSTPFLVVYGFKLFGKFPTDAWFEFIFSLITYKLLWAIVELVLGKASKFCVGVLP